MQEHEEAISEIGFVPSFEDISVDYDPGTTYDVEMHDGSHLRLRKLHEDYDPSNRTLLGGEVAYGNRTRRVKC